MLRVFIIIVAVFFAIKIIGEIKGLRYIGENHIANNTITINGEGEAFAVPDIARISFSVEAKAPAVKDAQTEVSKKIDASLDFLKKAGIAEKDIKTESYDTNPEYVYDNQICIKDYCPPTKSPRITGYHVSQTISVKVRDTEKTGAILQGLGDIGVGTIVGPDFSVDEPDTIQADARAKAIADAKSKAQTLAEQLGVRIGRIISFQESNGGNYPMYYAKDAMASSAGRAPTPPQVPTGENKYTSNVTIVYEIQ